MLFDPNALLVTRYTVYVALAQKYRDRVNDFCADKDNETPLMSFDKVTSKRVSRAVWFEIDTNIDLCSSAFFRDRVLLVLNFDPAVDPRHPKRMKPWLVKLFDTTVD